MGAILKDCPQFHVLVIGESKAGKSSLIRAAFGIEDQYSSDFDRGRANINVGLKSAVNKQFVLHNSLGFEPADSENYDTVKEFIRNKRTGQDRLHAIWFCIPITRACAWLPKPADENFFKAKKEIMGTIPLIVVYTKLDLEEHVLSEVESHAKKCSEQIGGLAGEPLPYAVVSTVGQHKATLQKLVRLTHSHVGTLDTSRAQILAGVALIAAQRVDPNLKVDVTIKYVGRQRYCKALGASIALHVHTIWDCLHKVHDDIVKVWNFHDPFRHLSEKYFRELIVKMAQDVEVHSMSNPSTNILALTGGSLLGAVTGILGVTAHHAAPIILPILGSALVGVWVHGAYRSAKNVQQIFIAYIVDLTCILETLYILTSHKHKRLTRHAIKIAYNTYQRSGVRARAHADIQEYRNLQGGWYAALQMIESLISLGGNVLVEEYYGQIRGMDLETLNLDQEGEWSD